MKKDYTEELLKALAQRLSGRTDCKQVQYIVRIGEPSILVPPNRNITITPNYEIYPDMHHRKKTDLCNVIDYVVMTKFYDTVYDGLNEYGHATFKEGTLTPGVYHYKLSFDKKRRRWDRLH